MKDNRRIDPEPFTIVATVGAVIAAATGVVSLWREMNPHLPSRVRNQLLKMVEQLDETTRYLGSDVERLERIFLRSELIGNAIKLGNGALLTQEDFSVYQHVSDTIFQRMRTINSLTLKLEKHALHLPNGDSMAPAKFVGDYTNNLDELYKTKDLSQEKAWTTLRDSISLIESLCDNIRSQLIGNGY